MPVNSDRPDRWKEDIARSVDLYNDWFMSFAPRSYRDARTKTTGRVKEALRWTRSLRDISPAALKRHPSVVQILRMATAPPIARDRLIGLSGTTPGLVKAMEEEGRIPPRMDPPLADAELARIGRTILRLVDRDIFPWVKDGAPPKRGAMHRAATVVADRLCGVVADPIIRNAQEKRQLAAIRRWLEAKGYTYVRSGQGTRFDSMRRGTFAFHLNVPAKLQGGDMPVNVPVDAAVMPKRGDLPLLIEAKSAGDFTNVNKRRKEEAAKVSQLRAAYGRRVRYVLFLCGYFDSGYLGYEAAEGIDWVWEHRIDDIAGLGV
jgi:hypothetical protein